MSKIGTNDLLKIISKKHDQQKAKELDNVLDQAQKYIEQHGDVQVLTFPDGVMDNEYAVHEKIAGKKLTVKNKAHLMEIKCTGDIRYCLHDYYTTEFVSIYRKILMKITKYHFDAAEFNQEFGVLRLWWEAWGPDGSSVLDKPNFDINNFEVPADLMN